MKLDSLIEYFCEQSLRSLDFLVNQWPAASMEHEMPVGNHGLNAVFQSEQQGTL